MFHQRLRGKRYFIVLDDVWEKIHWDSLASLFPVEDKGSRLLVTSRNQDITRPGGYVHRMKHLKPKESWELFMKKALGHNNEEKCPEDLKCIVKNILEKCDGLPLAIILAGRLVEKRLSMSEWDKALREINLDLEIRKDSALEILDLSYRSLPARLKSCFLCLGFFREAATISAKKLVQVWIAQGLIQEGEGERTIEDIGIRHLDELIDRNMVQVRKLNKDGSVKSCHIHDLLHNLSVDKAAEEISFEVLSEVGPCSKSLNKPRNRAVYCTNESFIYLANKNKYIRSLFILGTGNTLHDGNISYWKSFQLLRVLDFEGIALINLPDTISALTGLRYLGLRSTRITKLPNSLGRLKKLIVLDIATNCFVQVPDILWKMDSLRHLYMSHRITSEAGLRIQTLKDLQSLAYIYVDNQMAEQLKQITSLRKLGIRLDSISFNVSKAFSSMKNLVCLKVRGTDGYLPSMDWLHNLHSVTELKLEGKLVNLPSATNLPPNLSYLTLVESRLPEDPMPVLEMLPKLSWLKLDRAYSGEEMVVSREGFCHLKVLILRGMRLLKNIQVGKGGGVPKLQQLGIYRCQSLKQLPVELRNKVLILKE